MTKKQNLLVCSVILIVFLLGYSPILNANAAINVSPIPILIHPEQEVVISGVGFPAEKEVTLMTEGPYGVQTDITNLAGSPITNERGSFVANWELGRWASVNMAGSPGAYPLKVIIGNEENEFEIEYKEFKPKVSIKPSIIPIDPEQEVVIRGVGFPAEEEVTLMTEGPYGVQTDITNLAGAPTTNEEGSFVANWELGRWASVNMADSPGAYPLVVKVSFGEVLFPLVYEEK